MGSQILPFATREPRRHRTTPSISALPPSSNVLACSVQHGPTANVRARVQSPRQTPRQQPDAYFSGRSGSTSVSRAACEIGPSATRRRPWLRVDDDARSSSGHWVRRGLAPADDAGVRAQLCPVFQPPASTDGHTLGRTLLGEPCCQRAALDQLSQVHRDEPGRCSDGRFCCGVSLE